ncbi:Sm domain-containing protein [Trichoderma simmonsii]|uniref:Sm domain-containing protein n=1 Tax=Trichoderma simmonsii TaxID=1491479 RepID=A0A8G0PHV2_9HYPO|nr:Sm domain-containing protein [Trichoderma simmonsii]
MDKDEAHEYISSLLNQSLRVYTTDGRMFRGTFKCTDPDRNIVLGNTHEYRQPSEEERSAAAANASGSSTILDMTSRYLGLIVVPGHHIVKMEAEQFLSQIKTQSA